MTPRKKSEELIHKFAKPIDALHKYPMCYETSKQCALIAVDELIYETQFEVPNIRQRYWQQVKQEINGI